jgi:hypothetical protein
MRYGKDMSTKPLILSFLTLAAASICSAEKVINIAAGTAEALEVARAAVADARNASPEAVRVVFASGTYPVSQAVNFTEADSGTAAAPVRYEAEPGGKVVFDGGLAAVDWKTRPDGLWECQIPLERAVFEQLWVNGRRATRARTPNTGFLSLYSQIGPDAFPGMDKPTLQAVRLRPADYDLVKAIPEAELPKVLMTVCHAWTVGQARIEQRNDAVQAVRIKGTMRYPFVEFEPDQRFFLENYRAALDSPGEWFLKENGVLLYMPMPGETPEQTKVVYPQAPKFIVMKNATHLSFHGLTFTHGHEAYAKDGYHDGQAAASIGAVLDLKRCQHVHFQNCEVKHVGSAGIWIHEGSKLCSVKDCYIHDLGAGAVRLGDTGLPKNETVLTSHITIDNNILQTGGRLFPSACGLFLAHGADCTVTHNDIGDFFYTGISAGWVWGYTHSPSKRNRFDFNHIHHLGWGYLSDMGGYYGLGRSEGTTINNNHVHDVASYRYGAWGLYTDEGSTGVVMENNLVHDTVESTFHQHYGKWNRISNNIFAFGQKAQIQRSKPESHASFEYDKNIVVYDTPTLLHGSDYNWSKGTLEMHHNLYWNTAGLPVNFLGMELDAWRQKTGWEAETVIADPLFEDVAKRDFRLKPNSPAKKLGFVPFDYTLAGVRGNEWRAKAAALQFPNFKEQSKPWPMPEYAASDDFEASALSFPTLPRQEIDWENKGESIKVSDKVALSGKQSLEFLDAPGLSKSWFPNLVLKPGYTQGTVEGTLAIWIEDSRVVLTHEWRTEGHPYKLGPAILIRNGKFQVQKGPSFDLPTQQWVQLKIIATLASGKWDLELKLPGQNEPKLIRDIPCDKGWDHFGWWGVVSGAQEKTRFHVDDVSLKLRH